MRYFLSLVMMLFVCISTVCADEYKFEYTYNGQTLKYETWDGITCRVTGVRRDEVPENLVIPSVAVCNGVEYPVTIVDGYAFESCAGIVTAVIPNSVFLIEEGAFYKCPDLTSVVIGSSVNSIGYNVFEACYKLNEVHSLNRLAPVICDDSFNDISRDATLYVPSGSVANYNSSYWKTFFKNIKEEEVSSVSTVKADGNTSDDRVYTLDGRRVSAADNMPQGVYIVNKRKVVMGR